MNLHFSLMEDSPQVASVGLGVAALISAKIITGELKTSNSKALQNEYESTVGTKRNQPSAMKPVDMAIIRLGEFNDLSLSEHLEPYVRHIQKLEADPTPIFKMTWEERHSVEAASDLMHEWANDINNSTAIINTLSVPFELKKAAKIIGETCFDKMHDLLKAKSLSELDTYRVAVAVYQCGHGLLDDALTRHQVCEGGALLAGVFVNSISGMSGAILHAFLQRGLDCSLWTAEGLSQIYQQFSQDKKRDMMNLNTISRDPNGPEVSATLRRWVARFRASTEYCFAAIRQLSFVAETEEWCKAINVELKDMPFDSYPSAVVPHNLSLEYADSANRHRMIVLTPSTNFVGVHEYVQSKWLVLQSLNGIVLSPNCLADVGMSLLNSPLESSELHQASLRLIASASRRVVSLFVDRPEIFEGLGETTNYLRIRANADGIEVDCMTLEHQAALLKNGWKEIGGKKGITYAFYTPTISGEDLGHNPTIAGIQLSEAQILRAKKQRLRAEVEQLGSCDINELGALLKKIEVIVQPKRGKGSHTTLFYTDPNGKVSSAGWSSDVAARTGGVPIGYLLNILRDLNLDVDLFTDEFIRSKS